jgi:hypothetical protein
MRLLHGLRVRSDGIEVDELAVELGPVLRPDLLHGQRLFAEDRVAGLVDRAVIFHLVLVPASSDPELEAPTGQEIQARHFLGGGDGVALDDETYAGAHAELPGGRSRRHQ